MHEPRLRGFPAGLLDQPFLRLGRDPFVAKRARFSGLTIARFSCSDGRGRRWLGTLKRARRFFRKFSQRSKRWSNNPSGKPDESD